MKKRSIYIPVVSFFGLLLIGALYYTLYHETVNLENHVVSEHPVHIHPDYSGIIIPPNIAPLNFRVEETAHRYYVIIHGDNGEDIIIYSRKASVIIPPRAWKKLLEANRGQQVCFDIYTKAPLGRWTRYDTIANTIASEEIDGYLAYRKIPICVEWDSMGIYQRDLSNFNETTILHNSTYGFGCGNCHSFRNNDPDYMAMQIRLPELGSPMLMVHDGQLNAINTKTAVTPGNCGFTAWHPNGRIIAFTLNKFSMLRHTSQLEVRDVFDNSADLALYLIDSQQVISTSAITQSDQLETFPEWSPDGEYLYFCSSPQVEREHHRQVLCNLMRIRFDSQSRKWGQLETVVTADAVGGSITQPRFSPDGRYIIMSVSDYSDFPIHQANSNLYMLEVASGLCSKMPISSERNDSWHGFSSNGRWVVFNSKRMNGRYSRLYFSYFDGSGAASKPFVLPQKYPSFYDSYTMTYNIPELIIKPIKTTQGQFSESIINYTKSSAEIQAITGATPEVARPATTSQPDKTPQLSPDAPMYQ